MHHPTLPPRLMLYCTLGEETKDSRSDGWERLLRLFEGTIATIMLHSKTCKTRAKMMIHCRSLATYSWTWR
jgi:hypothetical protein